MPVLLELYGPCEGRLSRALGALGAAWGRVEAEMEGHWGEAAAALAAGAACLLLMWGLGLAWAAGVMR